MTFLYPKAPSLPPSLTAHGGSSHRATPGSTPGSGFLSSSRRKTMSPRAVMVALPVGPHPTTPSGRSRGRSRSRSGRRVGGSKPARQLFAGNRGALNAASSPYGEDTYPRAAHWPFQRRSRAAAGRWAMRRPLAIRLVFEVVHVLSGLFFARG